MCRRVSPRAEGEALRKVVVDEGNAVRARELCVRDGGRQEHDRGRIRAPTYNSQEARYNLMAIDFLIDVKRRMVFTVAIDVLSVGDAIGHMDGLRAHPDYAPTFNQIADFRDVTEVHLSGLDVRTMAQQAVFSPASHRALVIAKPIGFGLAHMFSTLREIAGEPHHITVTTLEEAAQFTGVDLDVATRACADLKERLRAASEPPAA